MAIRLFRNRLNGSGRVFQLMSAMIVVISMVCFLADFIIKNIVESGLTLHQSVPLIDGIVSLTLVHNTGAAFGLFRGMVWMLVVVTVIFLVLIVHRLRSQPVSRCELVVTGMITGGALSNLYDRVFKGYVVDYIDFGWWPVFNLSDSFITVGCALYIITTLMREKHEAVASKSQRGTGRGANR